MEAVLLSVKETIAVGVAAEAHERQKLERLCRYITRTAIAEQRLLLAAQGRMHYQLKTPYRDGTTHVVLEPLDFIARLAALVPKPRQNDLMRVLRRPVETAAKSCHSLGPENHVDADL